MAEPKFPTEAELSKLLDRLLSGWYAQPTEMTIRRSTQRRSHTRAQWLTTYALAAHAHRLAHGALKLWRDDFQLECMPLIRAAFEHALTAQFIAQCEDGVLGFFNEAARNQKVRLDDIARAGWDGASEIANRLEAWETVDTAATQTARSFKTLCEDLEPGGPLSYAIYRTLSALSHASRSTVAYYLDHIEDETVQQEPREFGEPNRSWWLFILCICVVWAGRAIDMLLRDHPRRTELREAAKQLQITPELQVSQKYRMRRRKARERSQGDG